MLIPTCSGLGSCTLLVVLRRWGPLFRGSLDISKVKEAGIREHILKKYLWVLTFHNYVCMVYGISSCMIKSGSTCDVRFMRMTAEVFKDDLPGVKQQNEN